MTRRLRPILIAVAVSAALVTAIGISVTSGRSQSSASRDGLSIGVQRDAYKAWRLALEHIARDAASNPRPTDFHVYWYRSWDAQILRDETERAGVVYDRSRGRLKQYDYGGEGGWHGVTDDMLGKAIKAANPWDEFRKFGCTEFPEHLD